MRSSSRETDLWCILDFHSNINVFLMSQKKNLHTALYFYHVTVWEIRVLYKWAYLMGILVSTLEKWFCGTELAFSWLKILLSSIFLLAFRVHQNQIKTAQLTTRGWKVRTWEYFYYIQMCKIRTIVLGALFGSEGTMTQITGARLHFTALAMFLLWAWPLLLGSTGVTW